MQRLATYLPFLLVFLVGMGVGALIYMVVEKDHGHPREVREFNSQYKYINPLLACGEDFSSLSNNEVRKLREEYDNTIAQRKDADEITEVSLYYRDLRNGPWIGINLETPFMPGSLLKVPLAMSVYKAAETNPGILDSTLTYSGDEVQVFQFFKPQPFPPGEYALKDLLEQALTNSNNSAANLIAREIGAETFGETYKDLGVEAPPYAGSDYTTTTRHYASFFRVLYNATYLSNEHSEEILRLLSRSTFTEGLVAGVPSSVAVAHKFGERSFEDSSLKQLHDCGIVYLQENPYLLCIMTRGYDFQAMADTIAELSQITYNYTSRVNH